MRGTLVGAVFAFGLLVPVGVAAANDQGDAQSASTNADADRIVCKNRAKTGTRFASKTCMSVREWEEMAENHKRAASEMIDRAVIETRRE